MKIDKVSSRHVIELILFFNRLMTNVETRYWSTKLKIVDIIWMLKKTRYIVKVFNNIIIIYIDHDVVLKITFQTTLFITFTNKLNFRLIRASNYIQRFNLEIRHKFDKQHVVSNVLFLLKDFSSTKILHRHLFRLIIAVNDKCISFLTNINEYL